jgi:uracil-DNA glycosylase family 4
VGTLVRAIVVVFVVVLVFAIDYLCSDLAIAPFTNTPPKLDSPDAFRGQKGPRHPGKRHTTQYNEDRMSAPVWLRILNAEVVACKQCPRLVEYRERIAHEKRRAYRDHEYWGKPVPGFGDPQAHVLVLGLAPGAHGSNRTGRPFTGDASGNFMYPILHETGFASQPTATARDDGQTLTDLYITAAARCAPPDNKPLPEELANCAPFLEREIEALSNLRVVVALGRIGFEAYLNYLIRKKLIARKREYEFRHGAEYTMPDDKVLLATYHPSNQNTSTGKLTRPMFLKIFQQAKRLAGHK